MKTDGMNADNDRNPILVTGAHRSGTTWAGMMLAASPDVTYISEPLNILHRPGVMRTATRFWYSYICAENQAEYLPALQETIRFQYHPWLEVRSLRSGRDLARMGRDVGRFIRGRALKTRALLKDPFAVFSAPWFAQALGCKVVILVRHPLGFVSSLKRLGWAFDFRDLLSQPLLMRDHLAPYKERMEACLESKPDIIEQGSLLWQMVYGTVAKFRTLHPEFLIIRHEDLSRQPRDGFKDVYTDLGLDFTPAVESVLLEASSAKNPDELASNRIHAVNLDSRANLSNWRKRLADREIQRILDLTKDTLAHFYPEVSPDLE